MPLVSHTVLSLNEIAGPQTGTTHEIVAFVGKEGRLSNRHFFCHTDHGYPDMFAVDARVGVDHRGGWHPCLIP